MATNKDLPRELERLADERKDPILLAASREIERLRGEQERLRAQVNRQSLARRLTVKRHTLMAHQSFPDLPAEVVAASDYDALAARLAEVEQWRDYYRAKWLGVEAVPQPEPPDAAPETVSGEGER